jgi:hypothetical protein
MEDEKATMTVLTPQNYHIWIKEIQAYAEQYQVWEYVDPDGQVEPPNKETPPKASDYQVIKDGITRPALNLKELSDQQRKEYKADVLEYQMLSKFTEEILQGIRNISTAVKTSARQYIPPHEMSSSVRQIIQTLAARYKLSNQKIVEQIHAQWRALKNPPVKGKIEPWIADWENLRLQMISLKLDGTFGDDTIFVSEFLRAGHKWAPIFCDNWEYQLDAAQQTVEFFRTTRSYRNAVLKESGNAAIEPTSRYSNAATLHGQKAEEKPLDNKSSDDKFKGRKCVCGEVHLFKECPYIVTAARKPGWKENAKTLNEARQRILKNARFRTAIKAITDTNILDGLGDGKTAQKEDTETAELDGTMPQFRFGNVAISATKIKNPLSNSVIYDSGCNQPLTYDKARFVGEITPANEWVDTPNGAMLVEGYGTMLVNGKLGKLGDKTIKMEFAKTAYIPSTNMTLVSLNKLKKEGYVWDMQEDVLIHKTSGQKVCNIEEHYGLATIEFNPVDVAVKKTPSLAKEDASDLKENAPLMAKPLAKEDASELKENAPLMAKPLAKEDALELKENLPIVAKEDAPTEEKEGYGAKEDAPTLKNSDTDPILAAVAAPSGGGKLVDHKELFGPATPASDWLKSAPDNPKWMDQKEDLIQSANGPKKRRSLVSKKRCKKRRSLVSKKRCKESRSPPPSKRGAKRDGSKIPKPLYGASSKNRF